MASKLLVALAAAATLAVAGCGGHTASTTSQSSDETASVSQSGSDLAQNAAPARKAIATKLRGKPLGRHASKSPEGIEDNEGPDKPRTSRTLPSRTYRVTLTGKSKRVGAVDGSEVGVLTLLPKTRQVCWRFARLPKVVVRTAAFGRVRMVLRPESASINAGRRGANGPVVARLYARYAPSGCTVIAPVVLNSIMAAPRFYYVSLGSATSPAGALRAQL